MNRGVSPWWIMFALSIAGTLAPHLLARNFLDDPAIVRWIAIPLLVVSGVILADYYLF